MTNLEGAPRALTGGLAAPLMIQGLLDAARGARAFKWEPIGEKVQRTWLFCEGETGAATALLRFSPGGRIPEHVHVGYEHIYMLSGSQSDGTHLIRAGDLLVHPPGSRHGVFSEEGCTALAIYEKRVVFAAT